MPAPTVLPGRAFQNTARKSSVLCSFRASDLLLKTMGGTAATFSRTSAAGRVVQKGLRRTDLATDADLLRLSDEGAPQQPSWGYFLRSDTGLYVPALVLGRAYTNLVTSDDLTAWTPVNSPTITPTISDPLGGTGAYRLADTSAAATQYITWAPTFTGDGVKSVSWIVREATAPASPGYAQVEIWDSTASAGRLQGRVTAWTAGVPTVSAATGTYLGKRYVGNGYWQLFFQTTSITAANSHTLYQYPAAGAVTYVGALDVYRVNAFNDPVPPPFILSASVARTADSLTFPYLAEPQEATYLYEGIVTDLPNQGLGPVLIDIGQVAAGASGAHLAVYYRAATSDLAIDYGNGTSRVFGYWTVTLALGDRISVRIQQDADGAISAVGLTKNGGAEDTTLDGAFASTLALPVAWASATVRFSGSDVPNANSALTKFVAAAGSWTTAEMQQMF